jgi:hypothetical protein
VIFILFCGMYRFCKFIRIGKVIAASPQRLANEGIIVRKDKIAASHRLQQRPLDSTMFFYAQKIQPRV